MLNLVKSSLSRLTGAPSQPGPPLTKSPPSPPTKTSSSVQSSTGTTMSTSQSSVANTSRAEVGTNFEPTLTALKTSSKVEMGKVRRKKRPGAGASKAQDSSSVAPSKQYPYIKIYCAPRGTGCPPIEEFLRSLDTIPRSFDQKDQSFKHLQLNFIVPDDATQKYKDGIIKHFAKLGLNAKVEIQPGGLNAIPQEELQDLFEQLVAGNPNAENFAYPAFLAAVGFLDNLDWDCGNSVTPGSWAAQQPKVSRDEFEGWLEEFRKIHGQRKELHSDFRKYEEAFTEWVQPRLEEKAGLEEEAAAKTVGMKDPSAADLSKVSAQDSRVETEQDREEQSASASPQASRKERKDAKKKARRRMKQNTTGPDASTAARLARADVERALLDPNVSPSKTRYDKNLEKMSLHELQAEKVRLTGKLDGIGRTLTPEQREQLREAGLENASIEEIMAKTKPKPGTVDMESTCWKKIERKIAKNPGAAKIVQASMNKLCEEAKLQQRAVPDDETQPGASKLIDTESDVSHLLYQARVEAGQATKKGSFEDVEEPLESTALSPCGTNLPTNQASHVTGKSVAQRSTEMSNISLDKHTLREALSMKKISLKAQKVMAMIGKPTDNLGDLRQHVQPLMCSEDFPHTPHEKILAAEMSKRLPEVEKSMKEMFEKYRRDKAADPSYTMTVQEALLKMKGFSAVPNATKKHSFVSEANLASEVSRKLVSHRLDPKTVNWTAELGTVCRNAQELRDMVRHARQRKQPFSNALLLKWWFVMHELDVICSIVENEIERTMGVSVLSRRVRTIVDDGTDFSGFITYAQDVPLSGNAQQLLANLKGHCGNMKELIEFLKQRDGKRPANKKDATTEHELRAEAVTTIDEYLGIKHSANVKTKTALVADQQHHLRGRSKGKEPEKVDPISADALNDTTQAGLPDQIDPDQPANMEESYVAYRPKLKPKSIASRLPTQTNEIPMEEIETVTRIKEQLAKSTQMVKSCIQDVHDSQTLLGEIMQIKELYSIPEKLEDQAHGSLSRLRGKTRRLMNKPTSLPEITSREDPDEQDTLKDGYSDEYFERIAHQAVNRFIDHMTCPSHLIALEHRQTPKDTDQDVRQLETGVNLVSFQQLQAEGKALNGMHIFWEKYVVSQTASKAHLDEYCKLLKEDAKFSALRLYVPELALDRSQVSHSNPMIARILRETQHLRPSPPGLIYKNEDFSAAPVQTKKRIAPWASLRITELTMSQSVRQLSTGDSEPKDGSAFNVTIKSPSMANPTTVLLPYETLTMIDNWPKNGLPDMRDWRMTQMNETAWIPIEVFPHRGEAKGKTQEALDYGCDLAKMSRSETRAWIKKHKEPESLDSKSWLKGRKQDFVLPYWKEDLEPEQDREQEQTQGKVKELMTELAKTKAAVEDLHKTAIKNRRRLRISSLKASVVPVVGT